jgi:hypothetical protein
MNSVAQKRILNTVIKTFYNEINSVWDSNDALKEAVANLLQVKENTAKMAYCTCLCGPLP